MVSLSCSWWRRDLRWRWWLRNRSFAYILTPFSNCVFS
jgi:hypothetical protein